MLADPATLTAEHGLFADAVTVLVDRPDKLVARIDSVRGPVVMKVDAVEGSLEREVAANRRLAAIGLPVPEVVVFQPRPPPYLIASWIDGEPLSAASGLAAQREAGEFLRRIHALGADGPYADNAHWDAWMAGWLHHAIGWWTDTIGASEQRAERLWLWFHALQPLLATRGHDQMLFDGRPDHVLVRDGRVVGLIDLSELRDGDAAMDLGVLAASEPEVLAGVLAGYRPDAAEQDAFDRLIPFYTILRRLAHAEWNIKHGFPAAAAHLLGLVDRTPMP